MILLTAGPMLYSLYLSFTRYNLLTDPQWVGFANFVQMFTTDPRFFKSVAVTLAYVLISVPLLLILSMLLALLLNTSMRFLTGYRAMFYLPSLMGVSVAIAALWRVIFGADGLVNKILAAFGIQHASWVGDPHTALSTIILLALVVFGTTMIIFLAGLRQVPRELYEAASVDGAGPFRKFFSITLPMMTPLIFFNTLIDNPRLPSVHGRICGQRRHRRTGRLDPLLHPVPLPAGLRTTPHGLRGGDGLGAGHRARSFHRRVLLDRPLLGSLRR